MSTIETLRERISYNSALVEEWIASKGVPAPSFDQAAPESFPSTKGSPEIEAARLAILEDTCQLHDLISGPGEVLRRVCWGAIDNAVQQCIYHFNILQAVPLGDSTSYEVLATKVGLPETQLKAIVRQSAMNRILREVDHNRVAHTASSAMLLRNRPMLDWYGHCVEELFPASAKTAEALEIYKDSSEAADSAFSLAFKTSESIYAFLEKHPDRQARFFGAMEGVGKDPGHSLDHVVNGYPWTELKDAVVVDVSETAFMHYPLLHVYQGH
jgi:O6-methylguanine-DNA--protein-cysteine methyltransferase